jgi:hypothetical protein
MAKKRLATAVKKGVYIQNAIHTDIFNLVSESGSNLSFSYFRRSLPIQPFSIAQGVNHVVENQNYSANAFHPALKSTKVNSIYSGDIFNSQTRSRYLITLCFNPAECCYTVYSFNDYFPKSLPYASNRIVAQ